ncbi:hypothetical protein GF340_03800 [Candidatus Peregrinibacteria bacterium]|nr:hypothetical protein [Candidatus Peregrinibacteria bacterium]
MTKYAYNWLKRTVAGVALLAMLAVPLAQAQTVTTPTFGSYSVTPTTFDPESELLEFDFTVEDSAGVVEIYIYDGTDQVHEVSGGSLFDEGESGSFVWDGKINQLPAPEKTYNYYMRVYNNFGSDLVTGNVTVDYDEDTPSGTAPEVNITDVNPDPFNPDDTDVDIEYTLNVEADVTVEIRDGSTLVDRIYDDVQRSAGTHTVSWDGEDEDGDEVNEDTYTVYIRAEVSGEPSDSDTDTVEVDYDADNDDDDDRVNITDEEVKYDPYNPDDGDQEIEFRLNRAAYVTVEIREDDGTLVKRLAEADGDFYDDGRHTVEWDGDDDDNDQARDGDYFVRIYAERSGYGSDSERVNFEVDEDADNKDDDDDDDDNLIDNIEIDNEIFDPEENEEVELCFEVVEDNTEVTIEILDDDRDVVVELLDREEYDDGDEDCVEWDGEDEDNDIVRDDVYQFRIVAENDDEDDKDVFYEYTEVDTDGRIIGFPNDSCGGFNDIDEDSPFCEALELLGYYGVFDGYDDGSFRPYNPINRAEVAKVVLLALDYDILNDKGSTLGYWDVQRDAWYMPYLRTAQRENVATGYPDGSFRPYGTINKVELLRMFLESSDINVPYCNTQPYNDTPIDYLTRWYIDYACFAKAYGLVPSYGGNMNPDETMTRGDVANLFYAFETRGLFDGENYRYDGGYYNYGYNNSPSYYNTYTTPYYYY